MSEADLKLERDAYRATLEKIDKALSGTEAYDQVWINYPAKPAVTPALLVQTVLKSYE